MSITLPNRSMLDAGELPVVELARIAMREGVHPRAVYQAHKWFARRLAITARALLVAAAADQGTSFWEAFYRGDSWEGHTVVDPFVGGGVMLLEASRLGAAVHGVDVEPVAAAIASFQNTLRELPDLSTPLQRLVESVGRKLAPFYEAQDEQGQRETMLHAFWVQTVVCGGCGCQYDAHPNFRFAWDEIAQKQWVACSGCSEVLVAPLKKTSVVCRCHAKTDATGGRIQAGEAICPRCAQREELIKYARRSSGPPSFRQFAVETLPSGPDCRINVPKRRLRTVTAFDLERYKLAEARLAEVLAKHPRALPKGVIPRKGRSDNRLPDYGYSDYLDMFNARQKLHLALLGKAISNAKGPARHGLAMAFSDHLTTNNMLCAYAGGWRRLTPLFSIRAYRHIARPVEINPWLQKNGRGTFPNAVRAVIRASEALKKPVEPSPKGLLKNVVDALPGRADIVCGDARRMRHIPTATADLVLTDPPYFDYISYSELGHFFTPWFARFGLIERRHVTGFPKGQLASATRSHEAKRWFAHQLAEVFREIQRVCKPNGRVVFTYQNLDGLGWHAIAQAMAQAGIVPIDTLPLYGDSSASLHKHARSISWDAIMVCRIGEPQHNFEVDLAAQQTGIEVSERWCRTLKAKKLPFTQGDHANIAYAAAIVAAFRQQPLGKTLVSRKDNALPMTAVA